MKNKLYCAEKTGICSHAELYQPVRLKLWLLQLVKAWEKTTVTKETLQSEGESK